MAEDEKTEPPTPKRRTDARKRGQVAKSQDLSAAVVMLGGLLVLSMMAPQILASLVMVTRLCLGELAPSVRPGELMPVVELAGTVAGHILWPIFLSVFILALVIMHIQVGRLLTFQTIKPKLNKLNPMTGIKRLFSTRKFVMLVTNLLKMVAVLAVTYWTVREKFNEIVFSLDLPHMALVGVAANVIYTLVIRIGVLLLVLALLDYAYQRYKHERELKMTKEEVKEELKRMEGDPRVKRRQREVALKVILQRMRQAVPQADVVVTNPTEVAVALKYERQAMSAPRVIAKGAGYLARRIREIAIEHGIPIVERPPLARALFQAVDVGQEIPSQLYRAVAEILAYVYELPGRSRSRARAVAV